MTTSLGNAFGGAAFIDVKAINVINRHGERASLSATQRTYDEPFWFHDATSKCPGTGLSDPRHAPAHTIHEPEWVVVDLLGSSGGYRRTMDGIPVDVAAPWAGVDPAAVRDPDGLDVGVYIEATLYSSSRLSRWRIKVFVKRPGLILRFWELWRSAGGPGQVALPTVSPWAGSSQHSALERAIAPILRVDGALTEPRRAAARYSECIDDWMRALGRGTLSTEQEDALDHLPTWVRSQAALLRDHPDWYRTGPLVVGYPDREQRRALLATLPEPYVKPAAHGEEGTRAAADELSTLAESISERMMAAQMLRQYRDSKRAEGFQTAITLVGATVLVPGLVASVFGANVAFRGQNTGRGLLVLLVMMLALAIISGVALATFRDGPPSWFGRGRTGSLKARLAAVPRVAWVLVGLGLAMMSIALLITAPQPSPDQVQLVDGAGHPVSLSGARINSR